MPIYAGTALVQPTPELLAWVEQTVSMQDIVTFQSPLYFDHLNSLTPYPDQRARPNKLGSLWWPQGATRWAVGNFLATESQLNLIRPVVYGTNGDSYLTATLSISDGTTTISPAMYMLPPRPLAQNPQDAASLSKWLIPKAAFPQGEPVYILHLVDDRFFWWQKKATIAIVPGTTTWASLISQIATSLGITITTDTISANYLQVPASFLAYQNYLPLILDLAAFAVGQRVVRGLDGTVKLQNATNALASAQSQLTANAASMMGGGQFSLDLS